MRRIREAFLGCFLICWTHNIRHLRRGGSGITNRKKLLAAIISFAILLGTVSALPMTVVNAASTVNVTVSITNVNQLSYSGIATNNVYNKDTHFVFKGSTDVGFDNKMFVGITFKDAKGNNFNPTGLSYSGNNAGELINGYLRLAAEGVTSYTFYLNGLPQNVTNWKVTSGIDTICYNGGGGIYFDLSAVGEPSVNPTLKNVEAVYDGNPHSISTSGGSGGTVYYSVSTDNSTWGEWSTAVPNRKDVGTTYVKTKVVGDNFHNDSAESAVYTIKIKDPSYTVTFDKNADSVSVGGLSSTTQTVNKGSALTLPTLTRTGYTFNGWFTAASGGTKAGNGGVNYTPAGNVTLYAQWSLIPATAPTISSVTGADLTYGYGSGSVSVSASSSSGHTLTYQWYDRGTTNSNSGGTAINGATGASYSIPAGKNAGTYYYYCVVKAKRNDNGETATATSSAAKVTVSKKALTITADDATKVYDGSALKKNTYTQNGLVSGDSISSVTVSGSQTDAGSSSNTASNAVIKKGSVTVTDNYNITYNPGTLTVTKATVNPVTVNISGWTYGDTPNEPTSTTGFGTASYTYSDAENGTYTDTVPTLPGTWYVKAAVEETANYAGGSAIKSFAIAKRNLEITAGSASGIYNGTALTKNEYSITGGTSLASGDAIESVTVTGSQTIAGTGTNRPSAARIKKGTEDVTDCYSITYIDGSLTVGKKALTVRANNKSITYGDEPANDGVNFEGFENGEDASVLSGTLSYAYDYAQYDNVGTYAITPSGLTSDNYSISFEDGTLTVEKKEVGLSWTDIEFTYDGTPHQPAATATGLVNSDTCTVAVTGAQTNANVSFFSETPAVVYTATAESISNANYKLPAQTAQTFKIKKAPLTIKANNHRLTYGDAPANAGVTYSGFVNGENENVLDGSLAFAYTSGTGTYQQFSDQGEYFIEPSGLTGSNYDITYETGTLYVIPKTVGIVWSNTEFVYDAQPHLPTAEATGLVNGDSCTVTVTGEEIDANVESFTDTADSVYTAEVTALGNRNYCLPDSGLTCEFKIRKAQISITADDKSAGYRQDVPDLTYQTGGEMTDEDLAIELSTDATNMSPVGTYPITVRWSNDQNYVATVTDGTYTVTEIDAEITAEAYAGTYDAKPHSITVEVADSVNGISDLIAKVFGEPEKPEATVYYAKEELTAENFKTLGTTEKPEYTDAGTYTVYYYVVI